MNITVEDILARRSIGRMQSVGPMQVIPILGEDDHTFAPPEVEAGTSNYGQVFVRNRQGRDTIIPPGSTVDRQPCRSGPRHRRWCACARKERA